MRTAINVENLGKLYRIGVKEKVHDHLGNAIFDFIKRPLKNYRKYRSLYRFDDASFDLAENKNNTSDVIWALRDVSFKVEEGEVIGIIGANGAGKSTLLKILSRITEPTQGFAEIRGTTSSLLEVGTGFHQELTGRENIYLNGTILGMTKKDVDAKFDAIVDFSGIEKYIDTPVKRYSSGMRVRLAFSVAAHLEPDILLIDEVLAVGDASFQSKCLGKMSEISQQGRTVLFVSHNMAAVENLCNRVILLEEGKTIANGDTSQVIMKYLNCLQNNASSNDLFSIPRESKYLPVIHKIEFFDDQGNPISAVPANSPLNVHIHYKHREPLRNSDFGLTFESILGINIFYVGTRVQKGRLPDLPPSGFVACHIPKLPLVPGLYFVSCSCATHSSKLDYVERGCSLTVTEADVFGTGRLPPPKRAIVFVDAEWEIRPDRDSKLN
jgi:lipopolysaccharide transport system ATP-binding protein